MRHRKRNIKFGRHPAHRKATVISLVRNLILYKRIETTVTKAKEAKRLADKIITLGKKGGLHRRRLVYSVVKDRGLVGVVFNDLAPLFTNRSGGYTRVIRTRSRSGDGAELAILEWTEKKPQEIVTGKPAKEKAKKQQAQVKPEVKKAPEKAKVEEKSKPAAEKPEAVRDKPVVKTVEEKSQAEKKPKAQEKEQKGFLGGLRKLFGKKKKD